MTPVKAHTRSKAPNAIMRSGRSRTVHAAMSSCRLWLAFGACAMLAACATSSLRPYPQPLLATQALSVRTDPSGASCSVLQDGANVASIDVTPGTATVRRDFCSLPFRFWSTPEFCTGPLDRIAPIDIACHKEGYLELRRTFHVARAGVVQSAEGPQSEPSPEFQATLGIAGIGMLTFPVGGFLIAIPAAAALAVANADQPVAYAYAYRALPEFFLTPATFPSVAARDAFFAALQSKLEGAAVARHAYVDAHCRFWPCKAEDPAPCQDLTCRQRRERVNAELNSQLSELPALREQTRIAAP